MTNEEFNKLKNDIGSASISTVKDLESDVKSYLDRCGLFYKSFIRIKQPHSIREKIEKRENAGLQNYKLQDLVGIRLVVYFKSDIDLCEKIIQEHFTVLNVSKDEQETDKFKPQRINYVCKLPRKIEEMFEENVWEYPLDKSFEIQIRTIFSEGWHEIEHDFRYKCQEEWDESSDLSRTLNGIFATLDNCDWAISSLFSQVAYRHYKAKEWIPMLKNVFLIRISDFSDMEEILAYFDHNPEIAKLFFRIDRAEFLVRLSSLKKRVPLTMRNVVFLANEFEIHDPQINKMTPKILLADF